MFTNFQPDVIDISHYDEVSSFNEAYDSGVKGCIIKCTQGLNVIDPLYHDYVTRAVTTKLLVGSYHFGTDNDGTQQAQFFLQHAQKGTLAMIDYESYPKSQMTVNQLEYFLAYFSENQGFLPLLYSGSQILEDEANSLIGSNSIIRDCNFIMARYGNEEPNIIEVSDKSNGLVLWQFTGDGVGPEPHNIAGITSNNVDCSEWMGGALTNLPVFWKNHLIK